MSYLNYSSNFQGVVDIFMHNPDRYLPFTQLLAEIMNGESELTKPQREMIALRVSVLNECHYCIGSHRAVLKGLGVDKATLSSVETGASPYPSMAPVLSLATKLTRAPGEVEQGDIATLRTAGWSDQTVEDVINVVSVFNYLNRLVDGFGVKGTTEGFVQGGRMIAERGYSPVVMMVQDKAIE